MRTVPQCASRRCSQEHEGSHHRTGERWCGPLPQDVPSGVCHLEASTISVSAAVRHLCALKEGTTMVVCTAGVQMQPHPYSAHF